MKRLNLKINDININLGMTLDKKTLKSHKIKKLGFGGLFIKKEPGQTIYWSKNCDIYCFADKFVLFPNLDTSSGTDMMYGTSAYMYFKNDNLEKVTFQLVGNAFAANWIIDKFAEAANQTFGEPRTEANKNIWIDEQGYIIAEKLAGSQHAHFHWIKINN